MRKEKWKTIDGFNGLYQISNTGIVWSVKWGLMKLGTDKDGYRTICLFRDGKYVFSRVNRLVAKAFITNHNNYPIVLHINDIVDDNRAENLKWGTHKHNSQDASSKNRLPVGKENARSKPIIQYSRNGDIIAKWESINAAAKTIKMNGSNICTCCRGRQKTAGGFVWKYDLQTP